MTDSDIFNSTVTFKDLGLREDVLRGITEAGFEHPTGIQSKLIPVALQGKDVIGQAKTGTGKTAAFGLPILSQADPDVSQQALILVPTRELAAQVGAELDELGKHTPIRTACIIGGESMRQQSQSIKHGGHILVGTPGRVMDMHGRGEIRFDRIRFVVLDEVDRMLDIGFRDDIKRILDQIRCDHQTIFCSATISPEIERLARKFMKPDVEKLIHVGGALTVSLVDQKYLAVEPWDKPQLLLHLFKNEKPETTVVFCRTKATVHRLTKYLREHGINGREIHGDLAQTKRNKVMDSLRQGNVDVLVASDLAARGLDVEHISHVVTYDLPEDPEVYVHRIGRTARAGRRGVAWAFVTSEEGQRLTEIEKLTGALIEKLDYPDFKPGPLPADVAAQRARSSTLAERAAQPRPDAGKMMSNRATLNNVVDQMSPEEIARAFPGGVVPQGPPPKRNLGGRFRRSGR